MTNLFNLRTRIEIERRNRIMVSIYAYAYECENVSLISDHDFDNLCKRIVPSTGTGQPALDDFFRTGFHAYTGAWIHEHPELNKVKQLYERQFQ